MMALLFLALSAGLFSLLFKKRTIALTFFSLSVALGLLILWHHFHFNSLKIIL